MPTDISWTANIKAGGTALALEGKPPLSVQGYVAAQQIEIAPGTNTAPMRTTVPFPPPDDSKGDGGSTPPSQVPAVSIFVLRSDVKESDGKDAGDKLQFQLMGGPLKEPQRLDTPQLATGPAARVLMEGVTGIIITNRLERAVKVDYLIGFDLVSQSSKEVGSGVTPPAKST